MDRFIAKWTHPESTPDEVDPERLESAEARLRIRLPADYREAVLTHGLPRPTIALLNAIVDGELELPDVRAFLSPDEMVESTEDWRELGLPADLVAFATDGSGNLFCFRSQSTPEAPQVFYFDHDFGDVRMVAPSFTAWIEAYCRISTH
jgi:hypothetical protein